MTGADKGTVLKLLADLGAACSVYMDETMRDLPCQRIQADEIWSSCYSKAKNASPAHAGEFCCGDVWTWTAIDAETRLLPSFMVGRRHPAALAFMTDLAGRLTNRVKLTTDGYRPYLTAVEEVFGADIDYAMLQKIYGSNPQDERRYSPSVCIGTEVLRIHGNPDPAHITPATSSARTSRCAWGCAVSPA